MIPVVEYKDCGAGLKFERPSLVKPQFANECDLAAIVQRFVKTGQLPNLAVKTPLPVQDVTNMPDSFDDFKQKQVEANEIFEKLPEELRAAMQHSPEIFFEWLDQTDEVKIRFLKEAGWKPEQIEKLIKQKLLPLDFAKADSAKADPAKADPAPADSAKADPAKADPAPAA